jgi:hypothetical protein
MIYILHNETLSMHFFLTQFKSSIKKGNNNFYIYLNSSGVPKLYGISINHAGDEDEQRA